MLRNRLLLGVAFAALCTTSFAFAQDTTEVTKKKSEKELAAEAAVAQPEEIVVYGKGEARQVQTVSQDDIALAAPGTSPLKVVAKLPSVNFQSADPFGSYEWSTRITVRGFNQNQLGFTLDDVPLGDMSYANNNGLHISRAISSENIGSVELAQGAGALGTASTSNLGGTLQFKSSDPKDELGVLVSGTYGSNNTNHEFMRVDTGLLPGGGKAFISYGRQYADKWKGDGVQRQDQVNSKFIQPFGEDFKLTGFLNYSNRRENDYQDQSFEALGRLGWNNDNISDNWPLAVQLAEAYQNSTPYPAPYTSPWDAYYNASGLRKDTLGGLTADWDITSNVHLKVTGYGHHNEGQGLWWTPAVPTPGGAPISIRTTEYNINRGGVVSSLSWKLDTHEIEGGLWYEHNDFNNARRFYGLNVDGTNRDSLSFQSDPFYTQWESDYTTKTRVFHLQDTWQIIDPLKVNFGFKSMKVDIAGKPVVYYPASVSRGKLTTDKKFLPQAGVNYTLNDWSEVFADYTKNARAFNSGNFGVSQTAFDATKDTLQPETSDTYELGYRFHVPKFEGVLALYHVKFKNRLLSVQVGSPILGYASGIQNVGGVTSNGFEAAGTWHFIENWSLFGSYAYNDSTYDGDVVDALNNITHTAGKTTVDTPKHLLKAQLGYDDDTVFGNLGMSYMSERYYTYTNDITVPSQTVFDATLGYRFHGSDLAEGASIQLNATNIFDKKYISTIGSGGFANSDPSGTMQTLLPGAPRQVFVTLTKQF
ncbi:MAG: TonB-dependent receptor [Parvibaculum sedimenti]|uniref:TonB-dependent receptor n=1 Tax=Parvibaculum sedimenti TaxID=2608632 RepID=UPI003BB5E3DF